MVPVTPASRCFWLDGLQWDTPTARTLGPDHQPLPDVIELTEHPVPPLSPEVGIIVGEGLLPRDSSFVAYFRYPEEVREMMWFPATADSVRVGFAHGFGRFMLTARESQQALTGEFILWTDALRFPGRISVEARRISCAQPTK